MFPIWHRFCSMNRRGAIMFLYSVYLLRSISYTWALEIRARLGLQTSPACNDTMGSLCHVQLLISCSKNKRAVVSVLSTVGRDFQYLITHKTLLLGNRHKNLQRFPSVASPMLVDKMKYRKRTIECSYRTTFKFRKSGLYIYI